MNRKPTPAVSPTLADMSFFKLLEVDREMAELRREYEHRPGDERRSVADWKYDSACAADMFEQGLGQHGAMSDASGAWRGYVAALAIDPEHGPAILTVGAIQYQLGRVDDAMALLLHLPRLAHDDSLPEIIDKAGDFLIDQDDLANAERLYAAAAEVHPDVAIYHIGLGYCAGRDNRFVEAVKHTRLAVQLEPDNYLHLSDLGFSLTQAGQYEEAESILLRATKLAPADYEIAKGNLDHLYEVWG